MSSITLSYAGSLLDRASALRKDPSWVEKQLADPDSLIIPFWRGQIAVHMLGDRELDHQPLLIRSEDFQKIPLDAEFTVYLGQENRHAIFAMDFSSLEEHDFPFVKEEARLQDLRQAVHTLDPSHSAMLGFGKSILHWHRHHRFCGKCGHPTVSKYGGHMRECTNPDCNEQGFPRIDPAVIMLVTSTCETTGEARCLLGHSSRFPHKVYSTLAGFVDPGESLEEAVAREILEEAGIKVGNISYRGSQPWPFPSQIMLGFRAEAKNNEICIDQDELVDARWFSAAELRQGGDWGDESYDLWLPRKDSIARFLINEWLAEH
ncbi:MAG: NAD(+) diphosphatase [Gammaproteobacteria bacterium]|nr:NAD(+) diphosphatase [Gammaproteobacteria bacterium]